MKEITKLKNLPARRAEDHKGRFGRVLVVAGSPGMCGAGCLAALGAQKAGAGLITLALPAGSAMVGELFRASIMSAALADDACGTISLRALPQVENLAKNANACAVGPGLGTAQETIEAVWRWTRSLGLPVILDADALNALSRQTAALKAREAPAVITPHPGEMARLTGASTAGVQADRSGVAAGFAKEYGVVTVLKGHRTVVADGERIYVNMTGNAGMAAGGMGDVLTGIITSMAGMGMDCFDAASLGVFVHGLAGDIAAAEVSRTSLAPEDLIEKLPEVFARLERGEEFFNPGDMIRR